MIFREGGWDGERGRKILMREKNMGQLLFLRALSEDVTCNLGIYPDLGIKLQPVGLWDDTQPTELHLPWLSCHLCIGKVKASSWLHLESKIA